jgi:hypothetical protein
MLDALKQKYGSYALIVQAYLQGTLEPAERELFEASCTTGELLIAAVLRSAFNV